MKKISINVRQTFDERSFLDPAQLCRAIALVGQVVALTPRRDMAQQFGCIERDLPWLARALAEWNDRLTRYGFRQGLAAVGEANVQATRVTAHVRDFFENGMRQPGASVAIEWFRKGRGDRFFHATFFVASAHDKKPFEVLHLNSLDLRGEHLAPTCLEQPQVAA